MYGYANNDFTGQSFMPVAPKYIVTPCVKRSVLEAFIFSVMTDILSWESTVRVIFLT